METLYIVIPAYNEEENIEEVVRQWYPLLKDKSPESRLVIADSGSIDNTHDILCELCREMPQLEILPDTLKQHGPKLYALYDHAVNSGADYIFQTDSDGQTDPDEFDDFWNLRHQYIGIFGNRIRRGDGAARAFVEHIVCLLLRVYFGVRVPDANAPFRLMKCETVKKYLYRLSPDYDLTNIMMTAFFVHYHEAVSFREISFKPRQGGINSVNIPKIIRIGWKALGDFSMLRSRMKEEL